MTRLISPLHSGVFPTPTFFKIKPFTFAVSGDKLLALQFQQFFEPSIDDQED